MTMKPTPKTILIAGNQGGGQRKSTTIATLADALRNLGQSTKTIAIDWKSSPPTLQRLCPDTECFSANIGGADAAMEAAYAASEDIVIIDSPSCYAENLAKSEYLIPPENGGARIVVGIIINAQSLHSLECGIQYVYPFAQHVVEYIVLAVNDESNANNVLESPGGQLLVKLAEGRVIEFPAYSRRMLCDHNDRPAVPSVHITQAENMFVAANWKKYQTETLNSVAKHAEWLVGNPVGNPGN